MIFRGNSLHCKGPIMEAKFRPNVYGRFRIEWPPHPGLDFWFNVAAMQNSLASVSTTNGISGCYIRWNFRVLFSLGTNVRPTGSVIQECVIEHETDASLIRDKIEFTTNQDVSPISDRLNDNICFIFDWMMFYFVMFECFMKKIQLDFWFNVAAMQKSLA